MDSSDSDLALKSVVQETTGSDRFAELQKIELQSIQLRRDTQAPDREKISPDTPPSAEKTIATGFAVYNTNGLAFSGGGIRSAAFCLGAAQALNECPGFKKIDYLSTVSGGGYMGACLTTTMARAGKFVFASPNDFSDQPAVGHLRNFSNYLLPRGARGTLLKSLAVVLRGLAANLTFVLGLVLVLAGLMVWAFPMRTELLTGSVLLRLVHLNFWPQPFALSASLAIVLTLFLLGWAFWRSHVAAPGGDVRGPGVRITSGLLLGLFAVFFVELQPVLLWGLFAIRQQGSISGLMDAAKLLIAALTPFAGIILFFANRITAFLKSSRRDRSTATLVTRVFAAAALWFAALVVPLTIWFGFLYLSAAGIEGTATIFSFALLGVCAPPFLIYLLAGALLLAIALSLAPNANSLHRLYRDRLSKAFLFDPTAKGTKGVDKGDFAPLDAFKLTDMSPATGGPYHLINAALNIQASKVANRRGRNADFFLFSSEFVGSDSTGYQTAALMQQTDPSLDLATAVAISGAAVSSDMGSRSVKALAPTLALLNIRLGYWMPSPSSIGATRTWGEFFLHFSKFYLVLEMLGRLDEKARAIYLTDGGHIENLGVYQLLKRGCRVIIAVDAEADPTMEFQALVTLERYARIDLGVRIDLPWHAIRATTNAVTAAANSGQPTPSKRGPHCAVGRIQYPNGVDGFLLYVKSSLSGDENDVISDYKLRNPDFPHESTGDQFFSEEQFEVYRALGFHAVNGFFLGDHDFAWSPEESIQSMAQMKAAFLAAL